MSVPEQTGMGSCTSSGDDGSFTRELCRMNRAWAIDATQGEELPEGWRAIARKLFLDIAIVMAERPAGMLAVYRLGEAFGGVAVELSPTESSPDAVGAFRSVRSLVERARRASERTCSTCGSPGWATSVEGRQATRCGEHAAGFDAGSPAHLAVGLGRRRTARKRGDAKPSDARPAPHLASRDHRLYDLADVEAALGRRRRGTAPIGWHVAPGPLDAGSSPGIDTDQQAYLRAILESGEAGCLRRLAQPEAGSLTGLDELLARAPHMAEVTGIIRRHLAAAIAMGEPTSLPAMMLVGEPGTGKSWFMSRLAALLGLPHRRHPMNGQSLKDGLAGAHPTWRNAHPGLVAKCLLAEGTANPLMLVDEVDKAGNAHMDDPYRAFYDLLEPEGARNFIDEYLGFPLDASRVLWVLAGNDVAPLPTPILDRLTIVTVPNPDESHLRAVAASAYEDCNAARRSFFREGMEADVLGRLLETNPRGIRMAIAEAMTRAAADGRRSLRPDDVVVPRTPRGSIGFR